MSDYRVMEEFSLYLRRLLFEHLQANDTLSAVNRFNSENDISLDSPLEDNTAKLSVFLYQVLPNAHVNNQPKILAGNGQRHYPPLCLDLFYLITPLTDSPTDNLIILGHVMQILAAHSTIRARFLQSRLRPHDPEVKLMLNSLPLEEMTRLWSAFNEPLRLSVCYQAQFVAIDSIRQPKQEPAVRERYLDVHQITEE